MGGRLMSYILFLDDERFPTADLEGAVIVRSVDDFIATVRLHGAPHTLSFDHDLGEFDGKPVPSGMDALHWLIDEHLDGRLDLAQVQTFLVHSANTNGNDNITSLWNSFAKHIGSDVEAVQRPVTVMRQKMR